MPAGWRPGKKGPLVPSPKDNESLRSPEFIDHLTHPRNAGEMEGADAAVEVTNPVCGDELKLFLKVEDGRIADVRFKAYGCAAALATLGILRETGIIESAASGIAPASTMRRTNASMSSFTAALSYTELKRTSPTSAC